MTAQLTQAIVDAYDYSSLTRIVDVGGGHGALLAAILRANPSLQGTLFDLEGVLFSIIEGRPV